VRRGGGRWREPPKGYKVVWKPRQLDQIDWNGLIAIRPPRRTANPANGVPMIEASPEFAAPVHAGNVSG
jgi:hypothetical protein